MAGCAAARAGIQRISEISEPEVLEPAVVEPEMEESAGLESPDEGDQSGGEDPEGEEKPEGEEGPAYYGHRARDLPDGLTGTERLAHLGAAALSDMFSEFPEAGKGLGRLGLILCLPSGYLDWAHSFLGGAADDAYASGVFVDPGEGERTEEMKNTLVPALLSLGPDIPAPTWTGLVLEDQAGFAEGVARAAALLSRGRLDSCLVGGVDSRVGHDLLEALAEMGLLQTPEFPAGFIPGEAGAFLLLRAPGAGSEALAWIDAAARGADAGHRFSGAPPVGDTLTDVVRLALGAGGAGSAGGSPLLVFGSVNGSPWTSNEWGYLLTRVRELGEAAHSFPVGSFGEAGSSFGPLAACMAIQGLARGYAGADRAVIVLSSESSRKGAVVMRRAESAGVAT